MDEAFAELDVVPIELVFNELMLDASDGFPLDVWAVVSPLFSKEGLLKSGFGIQEVDLEVPSA